MHNCTKNIPPQHVPLRRNVYSVSTVINQLYSSSHQTFPICRLIKNRGGEKKKVPNCSKLSHPLDTFCIVPKFNAPYMSACGWPHPIYFLAENGVGCGEQHIYLFRSPHSLLNSFVFAQNLIFNAYSNFYCILSLLYPNGVYVGPMWGWDWGLGFKKFMRGYWETLPIYNHG